MSKIVLCTCRSFNNIRWPQLGCAGHISNHPPQCPRLTGPKMSMTFFCASASWEINGIKRMKSAPASLRKKSCRAVRRGRQEELVSAKRDRAAGDANARTSICADRLFRTRQKLIPDQRVNLQCGHTPLDALHNGRVHAGFKQLTSQHPNINPLESTKRQ